jgi:hypothetical protein
VTRPRIEHGALEPYHVATATFGLRADTNRFGHSARNMSGRLPVRCS